MTLCALMHLAARKKISAFASYTENQLNHPPWGFRNRPVREFSFVGWRVLNALTNYTLQDVAESFIFSQFRVLNCFLRCASLYVESLLFCV